MNNRRRYFVYCGLFLTMFVNYLDRINLAVAARSISQVYGLTPVEMGYMFSAFLWTYILCLIPAGMLADRFGGRALSYGSLTLWSFAGVWTGLATSYGSLFASRLVLGIGESPSYPTGGRIIREWAPRAERGIAAAFLNCGAHAGLCVGSILVGTLIAQFGWRESFYITGALGLVLAAFWFALYRRPEQASWLDEGERNLILRGREQEHGEQVNSVSRWEGFGKLLCSPTMWALAFTQACAGYTLYLFMTWLPNYLAATRGMDVMKTGLFAAIPYGAAAVFGLGLGWFSDWLLRRKPTEPGSKGVRPPSAERRYLIAALLLLSSAILATPFVDSIWLIVGLFSLSLACVATAMAMLVALTTDLLTDDRHNGVAVGFLIVGGNLFGGVAPIVTGYVVAATSSFSIAFIIAGVLLLGGAAIVMLGARAPIETHASPTALSVPGPVEVA